MDFTSSLYLGLAHPSGSLRPWTCLTTGRPAALGTTAASRRVAATLARLQGCQRAALARSTLHAFVDVVAALVGPDDAVLVDAGAYPVAGWAVARAASPAAVFAHHRPEALAERLGCRRLGRRRPVVVADGWCPGCGGPAPLAEYLSAVRDRGGRLVVDDTQAFGILGAGPDGRHPYGHGGGGVLSWAGVGGPDVIVVSSLAKGFGAPVAVVCGGATDLAGIEAAGPTSSHSSPPSAADVHAAEHALRLNASCGDGLRDRLAGLVGRLRWRSGQLGLCLVGGPFPVQSLAPMDERTARAVHRRLAERGVRTVLQRPRCRPGATVTLLVTARHQPAEIDRAAGVLADALGGGRPGCEGGPRRATG